MLPLSLSALLKEEILSESGRKGHWNTCVMKAEVETGREEGGQQGGGRWRGENRARGGVIKTV